jgi:hypothetical protein
MSTLDIWLRIIPAVILLGVAIVLYVIAVKKHHKLQASDRVRRVLAKSLATVQTTVAFGRSRYEISLTDWGPDFTGEDDTLHRWRWVVKEALDLPVGLEVLMLGNEPRAVSAVLAALEWVEQQQHPQKTTSVIVGEVKPYVAPPSPNSGLLGIEPPPPALPLISDRHFMQDRG